MTGGTGQAARHRALRQRARVQARLRSFFEARGVTEVETPILSEAGNTDPNIESFVTRFDGPTGAGRAERWLRTSPEFPLKRLLAEGFGDCYELGRVFRNGESGRRHNPEFTMLEWYRCGWDHLRLIDETVELVQYLLQGEGMSAEIRRFSYGDLYREVLGLDPWQASESALQAPLRAFGIDPQGLGRDDWLDLLMTHCIEPWMDPMGILVVHDFPASQCALARVRPGDPPLAERFELYLGRRELANGYHELNDPLEQAGRFDRDNAVRQMRGLGEVPVDRRLLATLGQMPDCAGVALGIERLLMHLAGVEAIADVLAYAFDRA
ncbi:EF-P lysine aminoacylase EpmA [Frateuria aurantia]